jgi:hypothetical protein
MMRYLGPLRGTGTLTSDSGPLGQVSYELDGYLTQPGEVVASGEIHMNADALNAAFNRRDLSLKTDDGRTLGIRFSGKRTSSTSDVAHADVRGGLPETKEWTR